MIFCPDGMLNVVLKSGKKHLYNKCTKVQNPRYKDVTSNAYTSA